MQFIIPLLVGIIFYVIFYLIIAQMVHDDVYSIVNDRDKSYPNGELPFFLQCYVEEIKFVCAAIWPIYLFYRIGVTFGRKIYEKLIRDDEDRIAAWFI